MNKFFKLSRTAATSRLDLWNSFFSYSERYSSIRFNCFSRSCKGYFHSFNKYESSFIKTQKFII